MDVSQLMIGDWVFAENTPAQVTSILILGGYTIGVLQHFMSNEIVYSSNKTALERGAKDINNIKPIPLTQEILEKNGFLRLGNQYTTWCMQGFGFSLDFIDGIFGYYEQGHPHHPTFVTKYVHELQHALELCGIKNEITL